MSLPYVSGVGTLTQDPEVRFITSGKAVANLNLAFNSRKFNKDTQSYEDGDTTFVRGTIWGEAAENVADSLAKGVRVVVSGQLKMKSWEKDGNTRTSLELEIDEIGPSLKWAVAKVSKAGAKAKANTSGGWGDDAPSW